MQIELRRPRAHRLTGQPAKQELASVFQAKRASERGKRLPGKLRLISIIPTQPAAEASASGRRRS